MRNILLVGVAIVSVGKITLASEYLACGEKTGDAIQNCWTCGDTCTARLDSKGTFTVSGSGPTYSYDSSNVTPWWKDEVIQAVKNIVVEDGITSYNKDGELTSIRGKKIYTVEEAEAVTAHGDKFHVGLTYK